MSESEYDGEFKALWFFDDRINLETLQGAKASAVIRHEDVDIPVVADLSIRHQGPCEDQYVLEVLAEYVIPFFGQTQEVRRLVRRDEVRIWIEALPEGSPYPFRLRRELQA